MKIQYKQQKFQQDAARAVVDVFKGQGNDGPRRYGIDTGKGARQLSLTDDFTGFGNHKLDRELTDAVILENLHAVQRRNNLPLSDKLEGHYNLTIEMETGVGKTYTYIKTMYELYKEYGWSKYIIVVPSVAIREGVFKSFQMTAEHFAAEYDGIKPISFFIYNSAKLSEIQHFASDSGLKAMIINAQAFNAKGKDARRITMELDGFQSRRPIDVIAKTNPILIIDEPQSVEGKQTKEKLKEFDPLFTLRYSATHRKDSIYNMVYRLDAMDAYNKKLVKKIAVKGITESGTTGTDSFLYLESINLSKADPTATLQYEVRLAGGTIRRKSRVFRVGDNLYDMSGELEEYRDNYIVSRIDGRDDSVSFLNGIRIYAGEVRGAVDEDQLRRIQIRETILSHIQRERQLYRKHIKVLSLFFIDEVANYRQYDAAGQPVNGKYAKMFEEEYADIVENLRVGAGEDEYMKYLDRIPAGRTHAGYFSVDGKGKLVNPKQAKRETTSDDVSAYELIMKNKELLLDPDAGRSPVRFIFSHSALREGWDNPNVFQICTLKQSGSEVRKRQEVGRGLRLCVNDEGVRMDAGTVGAEVHNINVLTVIASESYDSFARGLQTELAEAVSDRPRAVTEALFRDKLIYDARGNEQMIDGEMAEEIWFGLYDKDYIDRRGTLLDKYYEARANGKIELPECVAGCEASVIEIIDSVFDPRSAAPEDARGNNVELQVDDAKLNMKEFQDLWNQINAKSAYAVDFDAGELIRKSVRALNDKLNVPKIYYRVESGAIDELLSREALQSGTAFVKRESGNYGASIAASENVKYDLIGSLVEETKLTRHDVVAILQGIRPDVFDQFKDNPEAFISRAAALINDEKATAIIQHITYHVLEERYDTDIFTEPTIRAKLDVNAMRTGKHLYDHLVYDSTNERNFARELEGSSEVAVYVKLPDGFYISTPVGHYNPDWAIAFREGSVKHIYFVAETKGSMNSMELRKIEQSKIACAREHFRAIAKANGDANVVYDVVDSYQALLEKVMR